MLLKHAVDSGAGDQMALRQLAETLSPLAVPQDGIAVESEWLPPDMPAFEWFKCSECSWQKLLPVLADVTQTERERAIARHAEVSPNCGGTVEEKGPLESLHKLYDYGESFHQVAALAMPSGEILPGQEVGR